MLLSHSAVEYKGKEIQVVTQWIISVEFACYQTKCESTVIVGARSVAAAKSM